MVFTSILLLIKSLVCCECISCDNAKVTKERHIYETNLWGESVLRHSDVWGSDYARLAPSMASDNSDTHSPKETFNISN